MSIEVSLAGKTALVTGAAHGIGRTVAEFYARAGADLMIADLDEAGAKQTAEELSTIYGVRTAFCRCDVSLPEDIKEMFRKTLQEFERLSIVAHIAGISTKVDFLQIDPDTYDRLLDINAKGTFFVDQAGVEAMKGNGYGKIINMCSMSGKHGFDTNIAYTASKFAVNGMTQAIARYASRFNINVNCVCPGIIHTAIWDKLLEDHKAAGGDPEEYWNERVAGIPLKRPQTEEDIAYMFLYLAAPCSDNMTGQAINITGGQVMH